MSVSVLSSPIVFPDNINLNKMNGLSHPYQMGESTFIFRGIRNNISFLFHFSMKFMSANRKAPDGTPRFAASHLGLFCLPKSHKKHDYINPADGRPIYRPIKCQILALFSSADKNKL